MFDSGVMLSGEIRCWSVLGVKGQVKKQTIHHTIKKIDSFRGKCIQIQILLIRILSSKVK